MFQEKNKEEDFKKRRSIKDCLNTSIQRLYIYIQKSKERLITAVDIISGIISTDRKN